MISKLWPARSKASIGPVTDLDAIVSESVTFRFKGKVHNLKPISLAEYLKFINAMAEMNKAFEEKDKSPLTAKDLASKYHAVIAAVCDTITLDDILSMEQAQVAALYQLVIDQITGQVDHGDGKKKRMRVPIYAHEVPSSSLNSTANSGGVMPKP